MRLSPLITSFSSLKVIMEVFFQKYHTKLMENSAVAANGECRMWLDPNRLNKYGNICFKHPVTGRWVNHCRPSRLSYMVHHRTVDLPRGYDCSHLCHNCRCINPLHINLERHVINNYRLKCKNLGYCTKNHDGEPDCQLELYSSWGNCMLCNHYSISL